MADLTQLNALGLQRFIDNDVAGFSANLEAVRKDDTNGVRALKSLVEGYTTADTMQENQFLAIGLMSAGDSSLQGGKTLIDRVTAGATAIDAVLKAQQTLFEDIDRDLRTTVKKLLKNQDESLASIGGQKLLDIFSDVDSDLGGTGGSGNSKSQT
ncbi:type VII secretion system-associated protein [Streptomyces sp. NPDC060000]|uniref:type VII secretion system-associated protein n=1 Tax=Streptomyces sp. NPDC060000 TaxID=3347031 RepID=UPI00369BF190